MIKFDSKLGKVTAEYIDCGSDAPLVILTHGKGGNRNTASKLIAEYLQKFNISSLRIDLFGSGDSDGKFEDISITTAKESVIGAIEYAKNKLKYSKLFLFGTSYGGTGVLAALNELSINDVAGVIFRSVILNYLAKTQREMTTEQIEDWKQQGFKTDSDGKLNYNFYEDMKNYTKLDYEKLSEFKILLLHADKDTKVLTSEVEDLKLKISQFRDNFDVVKYPNSRHGIDVTEDFDDMLKRTRDFIIRNS